MVKKYLSRTYAFLVYLFLYMPIFLLILFSFNDSRYGGRWQGFTFKWYTELFSDGSIMESLYTTIIVAVIASIISTVIGISLLSFFSILNLKLGYITLILAHITFNIPYVIFAVLPKLQQLNPNIEEAALDLGATPIQAFFKVILPEIMPGIITGSLLAFTLSLDDFIVSFFTTGSGVSTLSIKVYSMTKRGISPKINALSSLMFIAVLALMLLLQLRDAKNKSQSDNVR